MQTKQAAWPFPSARKHEPKHIVKLLECHAALLAACEAADRDIERCGFVTEPTVDLARAAVALARELESKVQG